VFRPLGLPELGTWGASQGVCRTLGPERSSSAPALEGTSLRLISHPSTEAFSSPFQIQRFGRGG